MELQELNSHEQTAINGGTDHTNGFSVGITSSSDSLLAISSYTKFGERATTRTLSVGNDLYLDLNIWAKGK